MKEASDSTVAIIDSGLFMSMAMRMAKGCKRVLYFSPECRPWKSIRQDCIGDGFEGIERIDEKEFWKLTDSSEIDCYCFPDSDLAGLQLHLEGLGKAVWGSRLGQEYEQNRQMFMAALKKIGLDVPKFQVVVGLTKLRDYLKDKEDKFIKVSKYRADMETRHFRSWDMDEGWLDHMDCQLMPKIKDHVPFMVFDNIKTDLEIGADLYAVGGEYPTLVLNGVEGKDKTYFSTVTKYRDLPEQTLEVLEAISPLLEECRYRNQLSTEIRVKDDKAYFIDATQRCGMPSTCSQHLLWENFPQIVLSGAHGELVDPEPAAQFSIEVCVTAKHPKGCATVVELPKGLEENCRFSDCCYVDGCYVFPPSQESEGDSVGWLCAIGNTPRETLDNIKELADQLPNGCNADVESLSSIIEEIEQMKDEDIPFTNKPMPEPAEVL